MSTYSTQHPARVPRVKRQSRREFLNFVTGLIGLGVAGGTALMLGAFFWPAVDPGPSKTFKIGRLEDYPDNVRVFIAEAKATVWRKGDRIGVISNVCTHLGCTVATRENDFKCPCHGSQYDIFGNVIAGPAPRHLAWHPVYKLPSGELEIDTSKDLDPSRTKQAKSTHFIKIT